MSNGYLRVFHVMLIVSTVAAAGNVKERCHTDDKKALLAINRSFNNSFLSWTPDTDCCRYWYGVKCDYLTRRVNRLTIRSVGGNPASYLSGVLPDALGDLPGLVSLQFHELMNITGTIPSSISKLQNLNSADFSWNSLSGPIPTFFRHMRSLQVLVLSYNRFSGSIPPELALGPSINFIDLSRNMLSGPIPDGFGSFSCLIRSEMVIKGENIIKSKKAHIVKGSKEGNPRASRKERSRTNKRNENLIKGEDESTRSSEVFTRLKNNDHS